MKSYEKLSCDSLYRLKNSTQEVICDSLYRSENSPVEVLTITLYKHHPCRRYPFYKEALITDLVSSWDRHTPDLWGFPIRTIYSGLLSSIREH